MTEVKEVKPIHFTQVHKYLLQTRYKLIISNKNSYPAIQKSIQKGVYPKL